MIIVIIIIILNIIMNMGLPNTPTRSKHADPTHTTPQGGKGGNYQTPHPNHTTPQGGGKQPTTAPHHRGGREATQHHTTGAGWGGTMGGGADGRTGIIYTPPLPMVWSGTGWGGGLACGERGPLEL